MLKVDYRALMRRPGVQIIFWALASLVLTAIDDGLLTDRLVKWRPFLSEPRLMAQVLLYGLAYLIYFGGGIAAFLIGLQIWKLYSRPEKRAVWILTLAFVFVLAIVLTGLTENVQLRFRLILSLFLVIVCVVPAVLYILFSMTRRQGMINEFLAILQRLGHLKAPASRDDETKEQYSVRKTNRMQWVLTFIDKFEATYGTLSNSEVVEINRRSGKIFGRELITVVEEPDIVNFATGEKSGLLAPARPPTAPSAIGRLNPGSLVPIGICTALITIGWMILLPPGLRLSATGNVVTDSDIGRAITQIFLDSRHPVLFAFLGAYLFSLQMLYRRFVRSDLSRFAYVNVTTRLIVSVIAAWIFTATYPELSRVFSLDVSGLKAGQSNSVVANFFAANPVGGGALPWFSDPKLLLICFTMGAFPFVFWRMITRYANLFMVTVAPGKASHLNIGEIDGLTVWHQARLEEEDIDNVPNLATTEVVDLVIHTQLPAARIIDWVDQAILYTALGSESEKRARSHPAVVPGGGERKPSRMILREHGIRTASEFLLTYHRASGDEEELGKLQRLLPADDDQRSPVQTLWDTLPTYTNLKQIMYWRGMNWDEVCGNRL